MAIISEVARAAFTSKQMGDACEMIVAAELTLAGIPALKVPDNWPGYDVIAQPFDRPPQRISVKARTYKLGNAYVQYREDDVFDWMGIVILGVTAAERSVYLLPRAVAGMHFRQNAVGTKTAGLRYMRIVDVERLFEKYRNNFLLLADGRPQIS